MSTAFFVDRQTVRLRMLMRVMSSTFIRILLTLVCRAIRYWYVLTHIGHRHVCSILNERMRSLHYLAGFVQDRAFRVHIDSPSSETAAVLEEYRGLRPQLPPIPENRYEDQSANWMSRQALAFLLRFQVRHSVITFMMHAF